MNLQRSIMNSFLFFCNLTLNCIKVTLQIMLKCNIYSLHAYFSGVLGVSITSQKYTRLGTQ